MLSILGYALIWGLLGSAVTVWVIVRTSTWNPARRHLALVLVGLAPPVLLATALLAVDWSAITYLLRSSAEGDSHPSRSWTAQLLKQGGFWVGWSFIGLVMGRQVLRLAAGIKTVRRAVTTWGLLPQVATFDSQLGAWVVPSPELLCLSFGVLRPVIVISEGMLAQTTQQEREVMVGHEKAHLRRRDTLMRLVTQGATFLLLPYARRRLLRELDLSAERACDEDSASRLGDRLAVGETIIRVERLVVEMKEDRTPSESALMAEGFRSSTVARVEALLLPLPESNVPSPTLLVAVLLTFLVALMLLACCGGALPWLTGSVLDFLKR